MILCKQLGKLVLFFSTVLKLMNIETFWHIISAADLRNFLAMLIWKEFLWTVFECVSAEISFATEQLRTILLFVFHL